MSIDPENDQDVDEDINVEPDSNVADGNDDIIRDAVDSLRKQIGLSKKEFAEDFGDLDTPAQYKALKRHQRILKKERAKAKKDSRNSSIIPTPIGMPREDGTGAIKPSGKVEWRIKPSALFGADKSKTIY